MDSKGLYMEYMSSTQTVHGLHGKYLGSTQMYMDSTQTVMGSILNTWDLYGLYTDSAWTQHEEHMGSTWTLH